MKKYHRILSVFRSFFLFTVFSIVSSISYVLITSARTIKQFRGFWTDELFNRVNFFYSLLILFSLTSVLFINNHKLKEDFENRKDDIGLVRFLLTNSEFWLAFVGYVFFIALLPILPPFGNLIKGFFADASGIDSWIIVLSIGAPTVFLIMLAACLSTLLFWAEKRKRQKNGRNPLVNFALQLAYTSFFWMIGGFAVSVAYPMLATAFSILGALGTAFLLTAFFAVLAAFCVWILFQRVRTVGLRRDVIKKARRLGKAMGFSLETKGRMSTSALIPDNTYHFLVRMENKNVACRFVSSYKKSTPVYLHENGTVIYENHRIIFKHYVSEKYAFDVNENVEKVIIVCPCNGNIFIKNDYEERLADVGDRCMEYRIYNASGFLNAIERNYL